MSQRNDCRCKAKQSGLLEVMDIVRYAEKAEAEGCFVMNICLGISLMRKIRGECVGSQGAHLLDVTSRTRLSSDGHEQDQPHLHLHFSPLAPQLADFRSTVTIIMIKHG